MSLALFRERLESGDIDATVRAHLKGCDECRAYYDRLVRVARALGDDGSLQERERLFAALPAAHARRPSPTRWVMAVAALVLAVLSATLWLRRPSDVQMRGGEDRAAPFSLRVYGKEAPGQPVRLIADFPGSREATVGIKAELQFFVKPGPQQVVVEARSALRSLTMRSESSGEELAPVGKAFPVGDFGPGNVEICAAVAAGAAQTLAEATRAGATSYCSTLSVVP